MRDFSPGEGRPGRERLKVVHVLLLFLLLDDHHRLGLGLGLLVLQSNQCS